MEKKNDKLIENLIRREKLLLTYLEHINLSCGTINVKFTVCWIIRIDSLTREKVHDILGPISVSVIGSDLIF